jgi:hypothetical protein
MSLQQSEGRGNHSHGKEDIIAARENSIDHLRGSESRSSTGPSVTYDKNRTYVALVVGDGDTKKLFPNVVDYI